MMNIEFLQALIAELRKLAEEKSNLTIITAMDAISDGTFETWVARVHDQLKAGHTAQVERMTSAKVVELIVAFYG